eukprot:TRINITY_DN12757_c0_g1_i1.p1 TRINITY_DN12757_c0_g1~~TRINITY_DN12757_c0_g1_i1.p1  ORF type:complete len:387 (+),score=53.85 TRINITY_DN12757_c0_g1_i1:47-1207(+)
MMQSLTTPLALWKRPLSTFIGFVDYLYALLSSLRRKPTQRFFPKGFGDLDLLQQAIDATHSLASRPSMLDSFRPIPVDSPDAWDRSTWGLFPLQHYRFVSPLAHLLPPESREGRAQILLPVSGRQIRGVAIHLAATGDQGFGMRKSLVARALAASGIASIIIEIPTYGRRRSAGQVAYYPTDVSVYLRASFGCMWEGRAWAEWAVSQWQCPCVLTGISYGGAMALGSLILLCMSPQGSSFSSKVATVSHVGSDSPTVLLTGVLKNEIDWVALEKDRDRIVQINHVWSKLTARQILAELLGSSNLGKLSETGLVSKPHAWTLSAAHDHFVVADESRKTESTLRKLGIQTASEWFMGGHVSGILSSRFLCSPLIEKMVVHLQRLQKNS